ncbi:FitA-like ribbon-helix-helix domain-containing protein [Mycetohabitans sp. B2]|uniref:FitA-like ribbon-helix-helix domain-containing protein n=1 Tax=Mycetohabitans sp. B2 TaxID=2841274 RepID=UPI003FA5A004
MRKTHDAAGRPSKRSAQRQHGAEASGMEARRDETRCARLDAQRDSPARSAAEGDAYRKIERSAGFSGEPRWCTPSVCVLDAPQPYFLVTQTECCALRGMANLVVRDLHDALVQSQKERAAAYGRNAEAENREMLAKALRRAQRKIFAEVLIAMPNVVDGANPVRVLTVVTQDVEDFVGMKLAS